MSNPELVVIGLDGAMPSHIKKMVQRGKLPAFKRLMDNGCWFNDCQPPFPTITPTCWSSFATGATPATHGAVCMDVHLPGKPLDELVSAYHSGNIRAERFWEAAARIGKQSLVIQMPASGPAKSSNVIQIGGSSCSAFVSASPSRPTTPEEFEIPAQLFISREENPGNVLWLENENAVLKVDTSGSSKSVMPFEWNVHVGKGFVELTGPVNKNAENTTESLIIEERKWTETFQRTLCSRDGLRTYRFKAKLIKADGGRKRLEMFFFQTGDVGEHVFPEKYACEIRNIHGIPSNTGHHDFPGNGLDIETFLEIETMNFEWQREVIRHIQGKQNIDIIVTYSVFIDTLNHVYHNVVEGLKHVSEEEYEHVCRFYDEAYILADHHIGKIMEYYGPETTFVIVSDHGSVGYEKIIDPFTVLVEAGLLVYDAPAGTPDRSVDWNRTLAFPVGTCHVFVNLKGRDPQGVVDHSDYNRIVQKIIRALQDGFRDKESGTASLAFALRREEAGLVGLDCDLSGDVVYGISGSSIGGYIGGVHACQIPTAKTNTGDIRSLLLMAGPGIKEGKCIGRPVHLYDAAPTLCHLLSYPQPENVEGAVIFQALC